jgi:hypothetical protein
MVRYFLLPGLFSIWLTSDSTHCPTPRVLCPPDRSPRSSTFNPSFSSFSSLSAPARISALLHRGWSTVTNKGASGTPVFSSRRGLSHSPTCSRSSTWSILLALFDAHRSLCSLLGIFFMSARIGASPFSPAIRAWLTELVLHTRAIGERLSPYVALACVAMAVRIIFS